MTDPAQPTSPPVPPAPQPADRDLLRDVGPGDRWLVVVAHPDDESFGCGSLIAHAAVRGAHVTVACATRGEAGEPAEPVDGGDLGAVRETELRRAAARLGAARVELLGYRDSGFDGDLAPGALCAVPVHAVAGALCRLARDLRPHVAVVLDGSDGHRDHRHVRVAAREAVRRLGVGGPRLYEHCLPASLMRRWLEETGGRRGNDAYHALDSAGLGRPDAEVTDVLDVADVLDRREAAMAEHRSQASPFDGLGDELRRVLLTTDHLARVHLPVVTWREPAGAVPAAAYWDLGQARWRPWPDAAGHAASAGAFA